MDKNKEMTSILEELLEIQKFENTQEEVAESKFTNNPTYSVLCC